MIQPDHRKFSLFDERPVHCIGRSAAIQCSALQCSAVRLSTVLRPIRTPRALPLTDHGRGWVTVSAKGPQPRSGAGRKMGMEGLGSEGIRSFLLFVDARR